MDEVERAFEVDCYDGIPLLLGHAHHESVFGYAGVVHKYVDRAEILVDLIYYLFCLLEVGGVGCVAFDFYAQSGYLFFGGFAVFIDYQIGEGDIGAILGEADFQLQDQAAS